MKIRELRLQTNRIAEQRHFFETTLGFTVYQENNDTFWVELGWTKFYFERSSEDYKYHYCFLIPANKLVDAMGWLSPKVDILNVEGGEKVVYFDTWNAHSFYFYDAAGNIAECIARHDLQNHSDIQFSISDFLCVNEIGLGTDNISKINQQLENRLGTSFWKGDKERFGANGSQEGLFLMPNYLVKEIWFPTEIPIQSNPIKAIIEDSEVFYNFQYVDGEVNAQKVNDTIEAFWNKFQEENSEYKQVETPQSYYFCDNEKDADECAELVRRGVKQATTHSLFSLQIQNEASPKVGDLAIVTDWYGRPKAITKTVKVEIVQYKDITAEYAFIEGEGDRSLHYWQKVHWDYYTRELDDHGLRPYRDMELVCESFETIWPNKYGL